MREESRRHDGNQPTIRPSDITSYAAKIYWRKEPYFSVALLVKRKLVEDIESRRLFKPKRLLAIRSEIYQIPLHPEETIPYIVSHLPIEYKETDFVRRLNIYRLSHFISAMKRNGDLPYSETKHTRFEHGTKHLFDIERKWYIKAKNDLEKEQEARMRHE